MPSRRRRTSDEMLTEEEDEVQIEPVSRPLTATMVHKILTNPFYTGKLLGNDGQYVPSQSHQALVTDAVFATAQSALRKKRLSVHYVEKIDLPARGFVRCAGCRRVYSPYIQKGIHYFYARCRPNCLNNRKSISLRFIESQLSKCLSGLSFSAEELAEIDARALQPLNMVF